MLGYAFDQNAFGYQTNDEVLAEIKRHLATATYPSHQPTEPEVHAVDDRLWRLGTWPMMQINGIVRRAKALQTAWPHTIQAHMHPSTIADHHLSTTMAWSQGGETFQVPIIADEGVPHTVWLPMLGQALTEALSGPMTFKESV